MLNKDNFKSSRFKPVKILLMVVVFVAIASALAYLVMLLWNYTLADVTNIKPLSFWKAAGLLLLAKILFGGIRGFKNRTKNDKHNSMRNKWMHMDPEEKKEAMMRWKTHCKSRKARDEEE